MSIKEKKREKYKKRKNRRALQYWLPYLEGKKLKYKRTVLGRKGK